jgi:steroid 5-alpha reductase family enzyme
VVQRRTLNSGWIDVIWSLATGVAGAVFALVPTDDMTPGPRQWIMAVLSIAWCARLGLHILKRTLQGKDDPRYAALIEQWGRSAGPKLYGFLMIQAFAALLLSAAILIAAHHPALQLRSLDLVAIGMLVIAIAGEMLADREVREFARDPANRGRICERGLWAYSRHPNYFFEWLGWLAWALFAIDPTGAYPVGWFALIAPVFMYWLLVHVSGIPPLEQHMLESRGDRFRDYQRRVNAFFPGPRRSTKEAA